MDELIEVIKKLQGVFSNTNIDVNTEISLPQIVVIGAQSSGKSSVLEGFVGHDFLPKGEGITTRRPLELHLNNCPIDDKFRDKYSEVGAETDFAIFGHKSSKEVYVNFAEVQKEIEAQTEKVAGKGISSEPISLSIYSHKVVKLTLVDLPGIVQVAVRGQPENIKKEINDMNEAYIRNDNSIILAVTPANVDISNPDAINLANKFDRERERTLAVFTKLDIMNPGTNAMKILTGEEIAFKKGIVGVINRCQANVDGNQSIEDCREYEKQYLQEKYPTIAHQHGIEYLARILHKILNEHIHKCLPKLRTRIDDNINKCKKELERLGTAVSDPKAKLADLIGKLGTAYKKTILDGGNMEMIANDDLVGSAKISHIFYTVYANELDGINLANELRIERIHRAVRQTGGLPPSIIAPDKCFQALCGQQIKHLKEPSIKCLDLVHEEMKKAIGYCGNDELKNELGRFHVLNEKIRNFVHNILDERSNEAKIFIDESIESHARYINTKHPDFSAERPLLMRMVKMDSEVSAMAHQKSLLTESPGKKLVEEMKQSEKRMEQYEGEIKTKMTEPEFQNCVLIRRLVEQYCEIIRKSVQDETPKQIWMKLVQYVGENLQRELLTKFWSLEETALDALFKENENISKHRSEMMERLKTLEEAHNVIAELKNVK